MSMLNRNCKKLKKAFFLASFVILCTLKILIKDHLNPTYTDNTELTRLLLINKWFDADLE
jgi:hypothetical protein